MSNLNILDNSFLILSDSKDGGGAILDLNYITSIVIHNNETVEFFINNESFFSNVKSEKQFKKELTQQIESLNFGSFEELFISSFVDTENGQREVLFPLGNMKLLKQNPENERQSIVVFKNDETLNLSEDITSLSGKL